MKSNFKKHRQQYLYVQSKTSKWLSPSLEMSVLPPGKPFHPETRVCWAELGLLWAMLAAMTSLAGSAGLSPAGSCPQAGSGSVGDTWAVSRRAERALALLRGSVSLIAHGGCPPVRSSYPSAVKCEESCTIFSVSLLSGVIWIIRLWFALQYSVLEFGL